MTDPTKSKATPSHLAPDCTKSSAVVLALTESQNWLKTLFCSLNALKSCGALKMGSFDLKFNH